jgi:hypothetical protein
LITSTIRLRLVDMVPNDMDPNVMNSNDMDPNDMNPNVMDPKDMDPNDMDPNQWSTTLQTSTLIQPLHHQCSNCRALVCLMVFNVTFNSISVISWRSVLLVEETQSTRRKPPTCRKSLTNLIT